MSRLVLVIDDETSIQNSLRGALTDEGYRVMTASSGRIALEKMGKMENSLPDAVLLDIWMTEMDGLETLQKIKERWPDLLVVMMSGHGTIETAVKATKLGAYDFIEKPLSLERLLVILKNAMSALDLSRENVALRKQVQKQKTMIGKSKSILAIKDLIQQVAPTTGSVLITGEHGTGKELVAHSLHALSPRFNKSFVDVNCAAIPEELIESELFGHEKGAFTGATQQRKGKFDLANGGTLFLDEIGDMSFKTQAKILRILQEQKFERVGGSQTLSVDVRIVAATNKDLRTEIQAGKFREDLYYRLNVVPFHVPPLRDRRDDIPLLSEHFLQDAARMHAKAVRKLTTEAQKVLMDYSWPGNVRELKNLIERIIILTASRDDGAPLEAATILGQMETEGPSGATASDEIEGLSGKQFTRLKEARQEFEKDFIIRTLKEQGGNVSKTASALGIERSYLHRKIKSYGIEV